jgi:hypothetical protein
MFKAHGFDAQNSKSAALDRHPLKDIYNGSTLRNVTSQDRLTKVVDGS